MTDPINLSPSDLDALAPLEIHHLALQTAGCATKAKLLLGRCLLSMRRTEAYRERGCCSEIHYAMLVLDYKREDAREMRLVARRLEELPQLTEAAESGTVSWSHLRSILRQATPETEEIWLERARSCSSRELEKFLREATCPDGTREADWTRLEIFFEPGAAALHQAITREICEEQGRMMPVAQVFEFLMADWRAGRRGVSHAKIWEEARRDAESLKQARGTSDTEVSVSEASNVADSSVAGSESVDVELDGPARDEADAPQPLQAHTSSSPDSSEPAADGPAAVLQADGVDTGDGEPPAKTPWAAADAKESACPGNEGVRLVAAPRWSKRIHFNPTARHVTDAQRTLLLRRDGYRCSTPGCPHTLWLHMHHIVFYCEGGATIPENLVAVCSGCHDNIHEGNLRLRGIAPHELRWEDAWGRILGKPEIIRSESCWNLLMLAA